MRLALIYDRNAELISFWQKFLTQRNFQVKTCSDPTKLYKVLANNSPHFILLDADLPESGAILGYANTLLPKSQPNIILYTIADAANLNKKVLGAKIIELRNITPNKLEEIFNER
ncbi:hypothetical protein FWH09_02795 [Candidatus Saccharibacteria bacterium]|nr:hypothetical protein [Candidatus Saccharibacteria bacterium]